MIAIAGGKGGCGKTTTTLGVALAADRPVRAVDLDRDMPDLHALAGVHREPTLAAADPEDAVHEVPDRPDVEIVPAPHPDERIDLRAALDRVAHSGPILLDCPCGAGRDAAEPLRIADCVVVVSTPTRSSLQDAAKTAIMARTLDTPVRAAAITGTVAPPSEIADLLGVDRLYGVPAASDSPLADERVIESYHRLAEALL